MPCIARQYFQLKMGLISFKCLYFISLSIALVVATVPYSIYECSACVGIFDHLLSAPSTTIHSSVSILESCYSTFSSAPKHYCTAIYPNDVIVEIKTDSRSTCQDAGFCSAVDESWRSVAKTVSSSNGLDIRVSKAIGSRGYNKVRLSVIANHTIDSSYFTYSNPFKYRWTSNEQTGPNVINTGIVTVTPGQVNNLVVEGQTISIFIPKENEGTRGVIIADPCFTSQYIFCQYVHCSNCSTNLYILNFIL